MPPCRAVSMSCCMSPMNSVSSGTSWFSARISWIFSAFVQDIGVGPVEKGVEAGHAALNQEMVVMDGAQHEGAQPAGAAKFEKITRVRQFRHGILNLAVMAVEPVLQLRQRHVRRVAVVKIRERQGKFRAKFLQRHLRAVGLGQNEIGGLPDGGQIVHQRARPVEDDVANHTDSLTQGKSEAIESEFVVAPVGSVLICPGTRLVLNPPPFDLIEKAAS